jgi:adenylate cyclase
MEERSFIVMTREEAKTIFNHNHDKNDYEAVWLDSVIDWIYNEIEDYLKTQMNNERRDFRDRCIFREVLEHMGGKDDLR